MRVFEKEKVAAPQPPTAGQFIGVGRPKAVRRRHFQRQPPAPATNGKREINCPPNQELDAVIKNYKSYNDKYPKGLTYDFRKFRKNYKPFLRKKYQWQLNVLCENTCQKICLYA